MAKEKIPKLKPYNGCKHKGKKRLYERHNTKWISTEYWRCTDCDALLKLGEVKE